MPIRREFVDWTKPALPAVIDRLKADYSIAGFCGPLQRHRRLPRQPRRPTIPRTPAREKTSGRNIPRKSSPSALSRNASTSPNAPSPIPSPRSSPGSRPSTNPPRPAGPRPQPDPRRRRRRLDRTRPDDLRPTHRADRRPDRLQRRRQARHRAAGIRQVGPLGSPPRRPESLSGPSWTAWISGTSARRGSWQSTSRNAAPTATS